MVLSKNGEGGYFSACPAAGRRMPPSLAGRWLWPVLALAVGVAGICAIWVAIAVLSGTTGSWIGLVAAVDVALLLRLTGAPGGSRRMLAAVLATVLATVLSQWLVVATHLGIALGLPPLASALRLGPAMAWALCTMSLAPVDWVLLAAGPVLAAILAEGAFAARS
jgi:hypothetical protein